VSFNPKIYDFISVDRRITKFTFMGHNKVADGLYE